MADPENDYERLLLLGKGNYGAVYKVRDPNGNIRAMKIMEIEEDLSRQDILNEVEVLKKCTDDFVVQYFEHMEKGPKIFVIMELCDSGSISDLMVICDVKFNEAVLRDIIASALLGLYFLHSKNVIHRDIKSGNLLLTGEGQVKLGDFGVSAILKSEKELRRTVIGTPFWMAPEIVIEKPYSGKIDVWSLGITLIELAEGEPPNSHKDALQALLEIPQRPPPKFQNPKRWSTAMVDFLRECLRKRMARRPTSEALLEHEFVTEAISKLKAAKPVGKCEVLKKLVKKNMDEIDRFRKAIEQEEENEDKDSESLSSYEGGEDESFVINDLLEVGERKNPSMQAKKATNNFVYGEDERMTSMMSSIVFKSFVNHNKKAPLANSVFFNVDFNVPKRDPAEKLSKEMALYQQMGDQLKAANEKYSKELLDITTSYDAKREALIKLNLS